LKPKLVIGETRNLKVTYADDLDLAAGILAAGAGGRGAASTPAET
jgi:2-C-methyl-D-erythritol 4-phosphate cytidylyltransferase